MIAPSSRNGVAFYVSPDVQVTSRNDASNARQARMAEVATLHPVTRTLLTRMMPTCTTCGTKSPRYCVLSRSPCLTAATPAGCATKCTLQHRSTSADVIPCFAGGRPPRLPRRVLDARGNNRKILSNKRQTGTEHVLQERPIDNRTH